MPCNSNLLRSKIVENGLTVQTLANRIGRNNVTLLRKMKGEQQFTADEIRSICKCLNIGDPMPIFFPDWNEA